MKIKKKLINKWINKFCVITVVAMLPNSNGKPFPWYSKIPLKLFVPWVHVIHTYSKQDQITKYWYLNNPSFNRIYMKSDFLCLWARPKKLTDGYRVEVDRSVFLNSLSAHKLCFCQSHLTIISVYLKSFISYLLIL